MCWLELGVNFKKRYGLSLRTPENLSAGRATCSNQHIIDDFYEKLQNTLNEHNLLESPEKFGIEMRHG